MEDKTLSPITSTLLNDAMTYEQFMALSHELFGQDRTTSEDPHYNTERILGFTKLNLARMARLEKTTVLTPDVLDALSQITEPWVWLILVESWCGDVAQILPVMKRIADRAGHIAIRLLLRDRNLTVMDAYKTNGGRSIPKLICLRQSDLAELGTWGPRPAALQAAMNAWKSETISYDLVLERVHGWYAKDRTQHTQAELALKIREWAAY